MNIKPNVFLRKYNLALLGLLFFSFSFASVALAHSTVSPSQTLTSKYETFTLSVPTEKDVPTISIRLLIPESLDKVTPFVKPGWTVNLIKNSDSKVTQLEWSGGSIPEGQKDVFQFTARTPAESKTLIWKVYQTYRGGEIVSWDRDPKVLNTGEEKVANPYSVTDVGEDKITNNVDKKSNYSMEFILSILALVISVIALYKSSKLYRN